MLTQKLKEEYQEIWYSSKRLFSYNRILNFVMSHRGGGKTFEGKKKAIQNFLDSKGKNQFIYIRRYKTELKNIDKFFKDIVDENIFPSVEFDVKGTTFYINKRVCGYAVALTQQVQIRSTPYPNVTLVLFDEFVLDPTKTLKYLKDEVTTFLEVLSTIIRTRNNVKVLAMANSISYVNPYFEYWNIRIDPSSKKGFYKSPINKEVIVELFDSEGFKDMVKDTSFGKLISGTKYGSYAIDNKVLLDNNDFIMPFRPKDSCFVMSFKYDSKEYGIWYSEMEMIYYVDFKIDSTSKRRYSITLKDSSLNFVSIKEIRQSQAIKNIVKHQRNGLIFFKNNDIKMSMYNILKYLGA